MEIPKLLGDHAEEDVGDLRQRREQVLERDSSSLTNGE